MASRTPDSFSLSLYYALGTFRPDEWGEGFLNNGPSASRRFQSPPHSREVQDSKIPPSQTCHNRTVVPCCDQSRNPVRFWGLSGRELGGGCVGDAG